jgi:hypothetical protein
MTQLFSDKVIRAFRQIDYVRNTACRSGASNALVSQNMSVYGWSAIEKLRARFCDRRDCSGFDYIVSTALTSNWLRR